MAISLNEYIEHFRQRTNDTRIVVFPNTNVGTQLSAFHKAEGHKEIVVGNLFDDNSEILPMPGMIVQKLQGVIGKSTHCFVTGIDAYLLLLEASKVDIFYNALLSFVDNGKANTTFILSANNNIQSVFSNPKYTDGMQLIYLSGAQEMLNMPNITLIPADWGIKNHYISGGFKGLLGCLRATPIPDSGDFVVPIQNFKIKIAGLSAHISQILLAQEFLKREFGFDVSISECVAKNLLSKKDNPLDSLIVDFGEENINVRNALKRLLEMNDAYWQAYVWMLNRRLPSSTYLFRVLSSKPTKTTLLRKYVVECAINCIDDVMSRDYAKERAEAIRDIGENANPLIGIFVDEAKDKADLEVLPWLNVNTDIEKEDIVRRASTSDLTIGLHKTYADAYPDLSDYLSDFSYEDQSITDYFGIYRRLKIRNTVTPEFAERAYNTAVPSTVKARNVLLNEYVSDADTALLVVDGMGAEYLPLICAAAKRKGIIPALTGIAYAEMPTSTTPFNDISWSDGRRLPEIKGVDNRAHVGAEKYEKNSFERNIVAVLRVLTNDLFQQIANALKSYKRVIITADHGSTRLGVLAHNSGIGKTIDSIGDPLDWRYCKAIPGQKRPDELTATLKDYWIVRGYNRLLKKGGKFNEMHGGATLEELLVPFVIFEKNLVVMATPKADDKKPAAQIVEKDDFDI